MLNHAPIQRLAAATLLAAIAVTTVAPVASADHGRRFKGRGRSGIACAAPIQRVIVRDRHSSAGPVLAGLVGGFILGSIVNDAHAAPVRTRVVERRVVCEPDYRYYDPYCERWYDSLDECRLAYREHRHARVIQVIDIDRDECVRTLRWREGRWCDEHDWDRDWDD